MRALAAITLSLVACGGKPAPTPAPPQPQPQPTGPVAPPTPTPPQPTAQQHAPEFFPPAWKKVGVGQQIHFGTSVIDQDLDETAVTVTKMPAGATFDAITQTVVWTPTKDQIGAQTFEVLISQPGAGDPTTKTFQIEVTKDKQPAPAAEVQSAVIEELLLIHDPKRLEQVNKDWPLDKLLQVGADGFKLQFPDNNRKLLTTPLTGKLAYEQLLQGLFEIHKNPRLDPKSPKFDKAAFGDASKWQIVAFRPRIDKAWTELRVVYKAVNAPEPVYAMFRLRPVVEYVPALPRPEEEREANNKLFLGMVTKRLFDNGGPSDKLMKDPVAHGKAVSALMTDVMTYDDTRGGQTSKPYLHGFMIGIAMEARMGGGSLRDDAGNYKSGDGWGWSAMKPFQTSEGSTQAYVNVSIPGFWTATKANDDNTAWVPVCAPRWNPADASHVPGLEKLCRKTMGFVDMPDVDAQGKVFNSKRDANNLFIEHKLKLTQEHIKLEDGRRDVGEENGMTCSQCHIRNFGMHDYGDPANTDPKAGEPKKPNHAIPTLNFQIIPATGWEAFTLEFLQHQECRGKTMITQYLGADAAKGLGCPLQK